MIPPDFTAPQPDFGAMQTPQLAVPPYQAPQAQKPRGMFGGAGKFLQNFIINYAAGAGNPMAQGFIQDRAYQRRFADQHAREAQQYQQHRNDAMQDYITRETWDRAHPQAPQPTEFERQMIAAGYVPGTPDYQAVAKQYVNARANPPYYFTDPTTGQLMSMPRNGPQMGAPAPEGVTFTPIDDGGPTPQASGGFPGPY